MAHLVMFHGRECPHCKKMMPLVEKLEQETAVRFEKLEVWHDEKNAAKMRGYKDIIMDASGGILGTPAFIDVKGKRALVGEVSYEELKSWAAGK